MQPPVIGRQPYRRYIAHHGPKLHLDGTDVVLRIKPFTGVGTYSLGSGNASAVFRRYLPATIASFACTGAGTSGTLIVTRYEAATRTLVGTFAFAANALPATGMAVVTGGTIDLRL